MRQKDRERAAALAVRMADDLCQAAPECLAASPAVLVEALVPYAAAMVRLDRKTKQNRKAARELAARRRHADALLSARSERAARITDLPYLLPFTPGAFTTQLVRGPVAIDLERPLEVA